MATKSKLAISIGVGVVCMPIGMATIAFIFSVANRLFVSDELFSGWHAAWSNPLLLAAVTVVVTLLRVASDALKEWNRTQQNTTSRNSKLYSR